MYPSGKILMKF